MNGANRLVCRAVNCQKAIFMGSPHPIAAECCGDYSILPACGVFACKSSQSRGRKRLLCRSGHRMPRHGQQLSDIES